MPTPPYARALVSKNGGTAVAGTITALTTDSLQLSPESTVGWQKCRWLLTFDSPGFTAPAGWILDTDGSITGVIGGYWYAASGGSYNPPAFTPSPWGKWVWKLLVNGAVDGAATQSLIDLAGGRSQDALLRDGQDQGSGDGQAGSGKGDLHGRGLAGGNGNGNRWWQP